MRPPEHDRLADLFRSRYRTSFPAVGYHVERRRFGYFARHANRADFTRIVIEGAAPADVPALLADARAYYRGNPVDIWLEDEEADRQLGKVLVEAGCARGAANVHLAHVGDVPPVVPVPGVTVEPVTEAALEEFAIAKLKGFANNENEPAPDAVAGEVAIRAAEMKGEGRLAIARLHGEAAAIIGAYAGTDWDVFNLATRVPFRSRGIANQLLLGGMAKAVRDGCRSVLISTDPDDTPIRWYRRIGFTDPVYRYRAYRYDPRRAASAVHR